MRIEVSVPGIRKERGKLPPPTTLGALRLALPLAGRPLIWGELGGPAPCEPVTGTQVGVPVATAHPVSAKTKKSTTIGFVAVGIDAGAHGGDEVRKLPVLDEVQVGSERRRHLLGYAAG